MRTCNVSSASCVYRVVRPLKDEKGHLPERYSACSPRWSSEVSEGCRKEGQDDKKKHLFRVCRSGTGCCIGCSTQRRGPLLTHCALLAMLGGFDQCHCWNPYGEPVP